MVDHVGVNFASRAITVTVGTVAAFTAVLAVTYLGVACESLPSLLGPVAGDTHPRTKLGAALLFVAVLLAVVSLGLARLQRHRR